MGSILDRSRHYSAHRGGLSTEVEQWDEAQYLACRSTLCCLAVWSKWVESTTALCALGGFRVLKKTLEAPYTTESELSLAHTSRVEPPLLYCRKIYAYVLRLFDALVRPTNDVSDTGLPRPGTCLPCRATAQGSSMGCWQPVAGLVVHISRASWSCRSCQMGHRSSCAQRTSLQEAR